MTNEPNEARGVMGGSVIFVEHEWYKKLKRLLPETLRSAFILSYHTGVRVGEMQKLRWRHVNLRKRIIHLPGEITKTAKQRDIFIPRDFNRKPGKPDELIFPMLSGNYRRPWRNACIKVGAGRWVETTTGRKVYDGIQLRFNRHTTVRNMVDGGTDRDRAKALSGHRTDAMFSRYNIGKDEDVLSVGKAVERFHRGR